jgi:hypothetical protein
MLDALAARPTGKPTTAEHGGMLQQCDVVAPVLRHEVT